MSFRTKLAIALSLVLSLTIIVSIISWWGMRDALNNQKQVYSALNNIEHSFHAMSVQEQAFIAEETISHSRQLFEHLAEVRRQILTTRAAERNRKQRQQLTEVLSSLDDYEKTFSEYVHRNLEMQTLRSHTLREAEKMHRRIDALVEQVSLPISRDLDHSVMTALMLQQRYLIDPKPEIKEEIEKEIAQSKEFLNRIKDQNYNEHIKLIFFRVEWAAGSFAEVFGRFADKYADVVLVHKDLRDSYSSLKKELDIAIATKADLVNSHIGKLQTILISTSALAVLMCIGVIILLSKIISQPIAQLKQSALSIVGGDLNTSVEITSNDEIGELGELFNQMTLRLRTSFYELETYRDHLERLVWDRTRELELEIGERRDAEKKHLASEKRFKAIFDNSTDGIVIFDPKTRKCLLANRTYCNMLGYTEDELVDFPVEDLYPVTDRGPVLEDFQEVVTNNKGFSKEVAMLRKNGSIFLTEKSVTMMELNGQPLLLSCIRDITERKAAEEQRLKMRKLESVGVLAGGIAHDFNNILAAILGNVSLMKAFTSEDDERYNFLKELEKATIRARGLTQQLLTFSKGGEPVKEVTAVAEIIRESAEFVLRGSNVRCDFVFADDLWNAEIDAGQISQVIQNIIVNARHAMPRGGVITVSCRNIVTKAQTAAEWLIGKKCLEIAISDNGPGIPEELHERIFDPYFTTKKGGSGLGLAITHSIISKHGGQISLSSPKDGGTTFTILLPAVDQEIFVKEGDNVEPATAQSGKTIMIMDDEAPVREITAEMLKFLGYNTIMVSDGQEAIERYRQFLEHQKAIDLVIVDLTIPGGMGGKEAAAGILEMDAGARMVVASGYSHDPIMANYESYGFSGFLPKPYQLEELQAILQQILR